MRALRSVLGALPLLTVAASVDALRQRLEHVGASLKDADVAETVTLLESMPGLRRLEVLYAGHMAPILRSPIWPRLEAARLPSVRVRRAPDGVHVTVMSEGAAPGPWVHAVLEALPVDSVVSFTLDGFVFPAAWRDLAARFPRVQSPGVVDRTVR